MSEGELASGWKGGKLTLGKRIVKANREVSRFLTRTYGGPSTEQRNGTKLYGNGSKGMRDTLIILGVISSRGKRQENRYHRAEVFRDFTPFRRMYPLDRKLYRQTNNKLILKGGPLVGSHFISRGAFRLGNVIEDAAARFAGQKQVA
jgi:hypothetical protein